MNAREELGTGYPRIGLQSPDSFAAFGPGNASGFRTGKPGAEFGGFHRQSKLIVTVVGRAGGTGICFANSQENKLDLTGAVVNQIRRECSLHASRPATIDVVSSVAYGLSFHGKLQRSVFGGLEAIKPP